jgi:hypothetical protein
MCCVLFQNGRKTALRLIEGAAKDFCRRNADYTYRACTALAADENTRQVERALDPHPENPAPPVEWDYEDLPPVNEDALEKAQWRAMADPKLRKKREWLESSQFKKRNNDKYTAFTHYKECDMLCENGIAEAEHRNCKCWCHDARKRKKSGP